MSIQSEIERINNAKEGIAEAISEKGVTVAEGTSIDEFPALVRSIPQNGPGGESVEEIFWITCDLDPSTLSVSNFSHTYDEIMQVANEGKIVKGKGLIGGLPIEYFLFDLMYVGGYSGYITFAVFFRTAIQGQLVCLYVNVKMFPDNRLDTDIMIVNTTDM